jgi:hypothetical protein
VLRSFILFAKTSQWRGGSTHVKLSSLGTQTAYWDTSSETSLTAPTVPKSHRLDSTRSKNPVAAVLQTGRYTEDQIQNTCSYTSRDTLDTTMLKSSSHRLDSMQSQSLSSLQLSGFETWITQGSVFSWVASLLNCANVCIYESIYSMYIYIIIYIIYIK